METTATEALRDLAIAGDWHGVIKATSGSNNSDMTYLWALAMTAHYGPTWLHASRVGAGGRPDPAKCADVPQVFVTMREAGDKIRRLLDAE